MMGLALDASEHRRPIKKIPKVGDDKFVIESIIEFEPEDSPETHAAAQTLRFLQSSDVQHEGKIRTRLAALAQVGQCVHENKLLSGLEHRRPSKFVAVSAGGSGWNSWVAHHRETKG